MLTIGDKPVLRLSTLNLQASAAEMLMASCPIGILCK